MVVVVLLIVLIVHLNSTEISGEFHVSEGVIKQTKSGFCLGDTIVYSGDVGREMYIMRRGLVEVLSKNKESVVATLGPGGYFGEVWNADLTHYSPVLHFI